MSVPFRFLVAAIFLLSGFTSLVYQVTWQRVLTQEVGLDATSVATIVTIFMTGLGFGALLGGRISRRFPGRLAEIYGVIEIVIGACGIAAIPLLRSANAAVAAAGITSSATDFAVNFLVLIVPTLLMGMTTPVIVQLVTADLGRLGRTIGVFYGLNILGAALGAVVSGLVLIELFGLHGSTIVAALVNLAIGAAFIGARRHLSASPRGVSPACVTEKRSGRGRLGLDRYAIAALLFGFVMLAYEIILFRVSAFNFASHVYVFPLMLLFYLAMMGLGNFACGLVIDRLEIRHYRIFLCGLVVLAAAASCFLFLYPKPFQKTVELSFLFIATLPVLFLAGFFPVMVKLMAAEERHAGSAAGRALFWFTAGNLAGALVTAFVLFEAVGSIASVRICLALSLFGIFIVPGRETLGRRAVFAVPTLVALAVLAGAIPRDYYVRGTHYTDWTEGREGVVTFGRGVELNRRATARVFRDIHRVRLSQHNMSRLMVVDPEFRPESILIIGLGAGSFAWGMIPYDFVKRITIVELSEEVHEFILRYSDPELVRALESEKVSVVIRDGRRYLQQAAARGERFDLIEAGTFHPDEAGSANLYSADFMEAIRGALTPGGYYATLDEEGLIPTTLSVFGHGMVLRGSPLLMFLHDHELDLEGPRRIPTWLAQSLLATSYGDLERPVDREQVGAVIVHDVEDLKLFDHPVNTDDSPLFEYRWLRERAGRYHPVRNRLGRLAKERPEYGTEVRWEIEAGPL